VAHQDGATRLLYLVTGLGHEAVMVFFVLSGFLISLSVFRSLQAGRWNWLAYTLSRLTRLYVVLVPALILCTLWDMCGTWLFSNAGVYMGALAYSHMALGVIAHQDTFALSGTLWKRERKRYGALSQAGGTSTSYLKCRFLLGRTPKKLRRSSDNDAWLA